MQQSGVDLLGVVRRCCGGDSDAWREFLPRFQEIGYRAVRSFRLSESDSEDVLSDVLALLYDDGLRRFRGASVGELVNFLRRIVLNEAIDYMKKGGRTTPLPPDIDRQGGPAQPTTRGPLGQQPADPTDILAEKECLEILRQEVEGLRREERELFLMKARGLKEREIVEQTGRPAGTVSAQIARLMERLRTRLRERGC